MRKIIIFLLILCMLFFVVFPQQSINAFEKEVKRILNNVSPSIVKVVSENHKKYITTGIAIEKNLVLTSTLITHHAYDKIYIKTVNGKKYSVKVVGKDKTSSLILLKLKSNALKPIKRAFSYELGNWISLVGAFYDNFPSIFQGIISSVSNDEIILNAPVVPGASGGAVVNKKGELIAVVRGRFGFSYKPDLLFKDYDSEIVLQGLKSENKDLCYAIPIKRVIKIVEQLKKYGKVKRGWLGVYILSNKKDGSKIVGSVVKGSPADKAGIKKRDVIISIDSKRIKEYKDITNIVKALSPGKVVKIEVKSNNKLKILKVKIGELKEKKDYNYEYYYKYDKFKKSLPDLFEVPEISSSFPLIKKFTINIKGSRKLGINIVEITPGLATKFNVREGYGLMISKIDEDSAAKKGGLKVGDIIIRANNKKTKTTSDIRKVLYSLEDKEPVLLELYRDKKLKKIKIIPEKDEKYRFYWDNFMDNMKKFPLEVSEKVQENVYKNIEKLKSKMMKLKRQSLKKIKEEDLEKIREEIEEVKKIAKESYIKELKKLKEDMKRMEIEGKKMRKELEKMEREKKKKTKNI